MPADAYSNEMALALIAEVAAARFQVCFVEQAPAEWDEWRLPNRRDYQVYVQMEDLADLSHLAIVMPLPAQLKLAPEERQEIARREVWVLKFLSGISLLEGAFPKLTDKRRERLGALLEEALDESNDRLVTITA